MPLQAIRNLLKRIKDIESERRPSSRSISAKCSDTFRGFDIIKKKEEIDKLLDRIRSIVVDKIR